MDNLSLCKAIAERIAENDGRAFYVGGYVRDKVMCIANKDIDIEVHGIEPEKLKNLLTEFGDPISFGNSFGIFSLAHHHIDIAMPRKERKTGSHHRDFEIDVDPYIGYEEACRRRDFTINAMMEDVLTGEIIDPFHGRQDLQKKILRCVDERTFIEDPLRVLRAAQFSARFHFEIEENTLNLCQSIDLRNLSKERIEEELKKALLRSDKPSIFFENLRKMHHLSYWFKELEDLIGLRQDPIYHPEGDVWTHTMKVIDDEAIYRNVTEDPYAFMLLGLCHDLGKIITTQEINGRIHSYGHETLGMDLVHQFVRRFCNENKVMRYLNNMVPLHMKPFTLAHDQSSIKACNKMFDEAAKPEELIYFAICDAGIQHADPKAIAFLFNRLKIYNDYMARPYVDGSDLIKAGLKPSPVFSQALAYAHKLRLAGVGKESALKQTLAYASKLG